MSKSIIKLYRAVWVTLWVKSPIKAKATLFGSAIYEKYPRWFLDLEVKLEVDMDNNLISY
jgi:hypothetical protein